MFDCRSINDINLSCLIKLKSIGNDFLQRLFNLESINLSGLSNVKFIGKHFMADCRKLRTIDLSSLSNLESIQKGFLHITIDKLEKIIISKQQSLKHRYDFDFSRKEIKE